MLSSYHSQDTLCKKKKAISDYSLWEKFHNVELSFDMIFYLYFMTFNVFLLLLILWYCQRLQAGLEPHVLSVFLYVEG